MWNLLHVHVEGTSPMFLPVCRHCLPHVSVSEPLCVPLQSPEVRHCSLPHRRRPAQSVGGIYMYIYYYFENFLFLCFLF